METEILQSPVTSCPRRSGFQNNSKGQSPERERGVRGTADGMRLGAPRELEQELQDVQSPALGLLWGGTQTGVIVQHQKGNSWGCFP